MARGMRPVPPVAGEERLPIHAIRWEVPVLRDARRATATAGRGVAPVAGLGRRRPLLDPSHRARFAMLCTIRHLGVRTVVLRIRKTNAR